MLLNWWLRIDKNDSRFVKVPPDPFPRHISSDNYGTRIARENGFWARVSGQDILLLCNQGYKSWETGSQARFVAIIIISIEPKKSTSMSNTLCCVVISWDLKKGQFSSKIHCYTWLKESMSKNVHLLFKGLWPACLSFNSFIPLFLSWKCGCPGKGKHSDSVTASQISLRTCCKEGMRESQYIWFWWGGNSVKSSIYFTISFLLVMRS